MIMGINELKTFKKHVSCNCKCKFDGRKCILFGILLHVVVKMANI